MFIAGLTGLVAATFAVIIAERTLEPISTIAAVVAGIGGLAAVYGLGMVAYMSYSSQVGKLRTRERLLDMAQSIVPWTGQEAVLDVGCGRGLCWSVLRGG